MRRTAFQLIAIAVTWNYLSCNENAIVLLENNMEKVSWFPLSENINAIPFLEKHLDKIRLYDLCTNINAKPSNKETESIKEIKDAARHHNRMNGGDGNEKFMKGGRLPSRATLKTCFYIFTSEIYCLSMIESF